MFILRVVYSIFHRLSHIPLTIACQLRNEQVSCIFFSASSSSSLPLGPCNYSDYLAQTYRQDTNHSGSSNNNAKSHAAPLTQCQVTSVSESLSPVPLPQSHFYIHDHSVRTSFIRLGYGSGHLTSDATRPRKCAVANNYASIAALPSRTFVLIVSTAQ